LAKDAPSGASGVAFGMADREHFAADRKAIARRDVRQRRDGEGENIAGGDHLRAESIRHAIGRGTQHAQADRRACAALAILSIHGEMRISDQAGHGGIKGAHRLSTSTMRGSVFSAERPMT
jgi:hypothetical protein